MKAAAWYFLLGGFLGPPVGWQLHVPLAAIAGGSTDVEEEELGIGVGSSEQRVGVQGTDVSETEARPRCALVGCGFLIPLKNEHDSNYNSGSSAANHWQRQREASAYSNKQRINDPQGYTIE